MTNFIDFHTHLLFNTDHGVQKYEDCIDILSEYVAQGFSTVVFTPHIYNPMVECKVQNIRGSYEKVSEAAKSIGLKVLLGSELYLETQTQVTTIPVAGRYALVEFNPNTMPFYLEKKLTNILEQHITPVIAHVERYNWVKPDSSAFEMMNELGCLFQVNVSGIENGRALPYIKKDLVDLIASDNHGDKTLPMKLKKCLNKYSDILDRMQYLELGE